MSGIAALGQPAVDQLLRPLPGDMLGVTAPRLLPDRTVLLGRLAQTAAVGVDPETAAARLLGYAVVHDPGRAITCTP